MNIAGLVTERVVSNSLLHQKKALTNAPNYDPKEFWLLLNGCLNIPQPIKGGAFKNSKAFPASNLPTVDIGILHFITNMATTRFTAALIRTSTSRNLAHIRPSVCAFSTSSSREATPAGPPPKGFRLPKEKTWEDDTESAMDRAGNYFLLTEMVRGMWVLMEQFFRPP